MSEEIEDFSITEIVGIVVNTINTRNKSEIGFRDLCKTIKTLQQKVEQLENIIKEATEILERHTRYSTGELLNILNKGRDKE